MMQLKAGVRLLGMKPETVLAVIVAESVYRTHGFDLVITSAVDGTHTRASKHYSGCAVDFRTNHVPAATQKLIVADLSKALGGDFDAILEKDHIHVEYDPKVPL